MKKNGFVFLETMVVLVTVVLSLSMLLISYTLLKSKTKETENYNKSGDLYILYNISTMGTNDESNYQLKNTFIVNRDNCNTVMGEYINNCSELFDQTYLVNFGIVKNIKTELNSSNVVDKYDNGTIEFLKTLSRCKDSVKVCNQQKNYMIGVFYRNNKYFYAAIEI